VELLVVLALILLNGLFAMAELALVQASRPRLEAMARDGSRGAGAALRLIDQPAQVLAAVQIGITAVGILAGVYGGATLADSLAPWLVPIAGAQARPLALAVLVVAITYLSLVVGELVPKRLALRHPELLAAALARPMQVLLRLAAPLVWPLERSSAFILTLLGLSREERRAVTAEEILASVRAAQRAGAVDPRAGELIEGVLGIGDQSVRSIMIPRRDMIVLRADEPLAEALARVAATGRSRYPLLQGEGDELLGVVRATDLAAALIDGRAVDLRAVARPPLVVPDTTSVLRLLELMKGAPSHLAIVVDEYGSIEGLATPADVLAALAGQIEEGGAAAAADIVAREDGSWLIDGLTALVDVERKLAMTGLDREDSDYHRLAGFVIAQLGRIPRAGDSFCWRGWRFEVVDMDGRRVDKVLVARLPDAAVTGD
jgi:putative hemolysin